MARTVGRKRRSGETGTALCGYCGARWYRSDLYRDQTGQLVCPDEGRGRDTVALTKANVASAKAYARSYDRPPRFPGQLDNDEPATPIASVTGYLVAEDLSPLLTEAGENIVLEN